MGGTFESRTVPGKGRRGCRLFSLWTNGYALERPVRMAVPVDDVVRGKLGTAVYTAVPCPVSSAEERIDSRKHLAKANETECRLEDGTRVPGGTCIQVERHVLDSTPDPRKYYDLLESLRGVVKAGIIQEPPVFHSSAAAFLASAHAYSFMAPMLARPAAIFSSSVMYSQACCHVILITRSSVSSLISSGMAGPSIGSEANIRWILRPATFFQSSKYSADLAFFMLSSAGVPIVLSIVSANSGGCAFCTPLALENWGISHDFF